MIIYRVVIVLPTIVELCSVVHHMIQIHACISAHSIRSLNPDFPAGPASKPRIDLPTADRLMSTLSFAIFQD